MPSIDSHRQATRRDDPAPEPVLWPASDASRIGAPLAWAIAVTTIATVFAIIAIIANYAALNGRGEAQLVQVELPASRYEAIGALINAAGEPCAKVCSIRPEPNLSGATRLSVACAPSTAPRSCATPLRYAIAVTPED
jgi:hypothetical protein